MRKDVVNSSGNVFIDLGYSPYEAAILQMRAVLMADLRKLVKAKKLRQAKAVEILPTCFYENLPNPDSKSS